MRQNHAGLLLQVSKVRFFLFFFLCVCTLVLYIVFVSFHLFRSGIWPPSLWPRTGRKSCHFIGKQCYVCRVCCLMLFSPNKGKNEFLLKVTWFCPSSSVVRYIFWEANGCGRRALDIIFKQEECFQAGPEDWEDPDSVQHNSGGFMQGAAAARQRGKRTSLWHIRSCFK